MTASVNPSVKSKSTKMDMGKVRNTVVAWLFGLALLVIIAYALFT